VRPGATKPAPPVWKTMAGQQLRCRTQPLSLQGTDYKHKAGTDVSMYTNSYTTSTHPLFLVQFLTYTFSYFMLQYFLYTNISFDKVSLWWNNLLSLYYLVFTILLKNWCLYLSIKTSNHWTCFQRCFEHSKDNIFYL
jgi:hypothetical protein